MYTSGNNHYAISLFSAVQDNGYYLCLNVAIYEIKINTFLHLT